jgi:hypothetical protein
MSEYHYSVVLQYVKVFEKSDIISVLLRSTPSSILFMCRLGPNGVQFISLHVVSNPCTVSMYAHMSITWSCSYSM